MSKALVFGVLMLSCALSVWAQDGGCVCSADSMPVCGSDARTYSNPCRLQCAQRTNPDLKKHSDGNCPDPDLDCVCPRIYRPVCGTDGRTYSNQCLLECGQETYPQMKKAHDGACRTAS